MPPSSCSVSLSENPTARLAFSQSATLESVSINQAVPLPRRDPPGRALDDVSQSKLCQPVAAN